MKILTTITLTLLATGCVHTSPRDWWPDEHRKMMAECRAMCKGDVGSYTPYDGECKCRNKRSSK